MCVLKLHQATLNELEADTGHVVKPNNSIGYVNLGPRPTYTSRLNFEMRSKTQMSGHINHYIIVCRSMQSALALCNGRVGSST